MDNDMNKEKFFYKSLKRHGYIFPETREELQSFEDDIFKMKLKIPKKLDDPLEILKAGKTGEIPHFNSFHQDEIEENLAQAAREGSDIPSDVWEQMEKDRKDSEEKDDEQTE